jgi:hypothetical protein
MRPVAGGALILGRCHDDDGADSLQHLRDGGNPGRVHPVVVGDQDAIRRRFGSGLCGGAAEVGGAGEQQHSDC